jgi:hypothetical protein
MRGVDSKTIAVHDHAHNRRKDHVIGGLAHPGRRAVPRPEAVGRRAQGSLRLGEMRHGFARGVPALLFPLGLGCERGHSAAVFPERIPIRS